MMHTQQDLHGKKIQTVFFHGDGDPVLSAQNNETLIVQRLELGDREEYWICKIENGVETARYSMRYVDSIVWKDETPAPVDDSDIPAFLRKQAN